MSSEQWLKTESSLHEQRRARPTRLLIQSPYLRDGVVFPLNLLDYGRDSLLACFYHRLTHV